MRRYPRWVVLSGAGISAESGIPTYRDRDGDWRAPEPVREQAFCSEYHTRQRYWARSYHGWPRVRDAQPGPAHAALAALEAQGRVSLTISQNVDGLHQRAGSKNVIDLHGRVDSVRCLDCGGLTPRETMQARLAPQMSGAARFDPEPRPDGDADIPAEQYASLAVPPCTDCGGTVTPNVVFFGGSVPRKRVQACRAAVADADALLVVGSSLAVYSGFRFCRQAHQHGKPIVLVNPGWTRADDIATLKLPSEAGGLLQSVAAALARQTA
ncbi:MAG: NAD-dependent protein deacetylase [Halioglobus sp.]|nr:NAD-dependent protein deacetylase [Halioglobus sp.]